MSFVSIIASPDRASVTSDNFMNETDLCGETKTVPGSKPAFFQLSLHQLIACTGSARLLRQLKADYPYREKDYVLDSQFFGELKQRILGCVKIPQDIVIAVVDGSGKQICCRMIANSRKTEWRTVYPEPNRFATLILAERVIDEEQAKNLDAYLKRQMQSGDNTFLDFSRAQKQLIHHAQRFDPAIGGRIFHVEIHG